MRRVAPFLVLVFVLAGCGGAQTVMPTAETVVGTVAAEKQQAAGDGICICRENAGHGANLGLNFPRCVGIVLDAVDFQANAPRRRMG